MSQNDFAQAVKDHYGLESIFPEFEEWGKICINPTWNVVFFFFDSMIELRSVEFIQIESRRVLCKQEMHLKMHLLNQAKHHKEIMDLVWGGDLLIRQEGYDSPTLFDRIDALLSQRKCPMV